jgi:hypothetical protein
MKAGTDSPLKPQKGRREPDGPRPLLVFFVIKKIALLVCHMANGKQCE